MKITHVLGKKRKSKEGNGRLFLSNSTSYLLLDEDTKYGGWFVEIDSMIKILSSLEVEGEVSERINSFDSVSLRRKGLEKYSLEGNSLIFSSNLKKNVKLVFDIRRSYDLSDDEQKYSISRKGRDLFLSFKKRNEFSLVVKICGFEKYEIIDKWEERYYEEDERRKSNPVRRWVYAGIRGEVKNLRLEVVKFNGKNISVKNKKVKQEKDFVYNAAKNALQNLTNEGIRAGWPWFFQYWTRDELISSYGLHLTGEKKVKELLLDRLSRINEVGRLPNILSGEGLGSADSIGWLFVRISQLIHLFNEKEKKLIKEKLEKVIHLHISFHHKTGFFVNGPLETWMDTKFGDDTREGVRIEIQAFMLNMFKLAFLLTENKLYARMEKSLANNIRNFFFKDGLLYDGIDDDTIRPNVFLAYYSYPELLTKKEWEEVFDNTLSALWCDFGGVATIDKSNSLFCEEYTGEDNRSYHRGDSWYFLNNICGICLIGVNSKKFGKFIKKLYSASEFDLLWNGAIGHSSEVSSANKQSADGCISQAWSVATFIEFGKLLKKF